MTYGGLKMDHDHIIMYDDMIYFAGKFYGDCAVMTPEELTVFRSKNPEVKVLSSEDFDKQRLIDVEEVKKLSPVPTRIPTLIISSEGGINQTYTSNVRMVVYNLDADVMEADLDNKEYFEDRKSDVTMLEGEQFTKFMVAEETDWNEKMDNHPSFNHEDDDDDDDDEETAMENWVSGVDLNQVPDEL
jgi:hypothetical protein